MREGCVGGASNIGVRRAGGDAAPRWSGEGAARGRRARLREGGADTEGSSCAALGLCIGGFRDNK